MATEPHFTCSLVDIYQEGLKETTRLREHLKH